MHVLHLSFMLDAWLDSTFLNLSLVFILQEVVYANLFYYVMRAD